MYSPNYTITNKILKNIGTIEASKEVIDNAPEVTECHTITGAVEYLLRVEVTDIKSYKKFHTDIYRHFNEKIFLL